jgi:hypothetical protein
MMDNSSNSRQSGRRTPATESKQVSNSEIKDVGRIIALEEQSQRSESKLAALASSVDDIKLTQINLASDMRTNQGEILSNMRIRDTQLQDMITQQNNDIDDKFKNSLTAIANMITSSTLNNNTNNNAVSVTPYSTEVEFVPATPQSVDNSSRGPGLFPSTEQGVMTSNARMPVIDNHPVHIKKEPIEDKSSTWYAAASGTLHPAPAGISFNSTVESITAAAVREQAAMLAEYKARAENTRVYQQSEDRKMAAPDQRPLEAPTPHRVQLANTNPTDSANEGAYPYTGGNIRSLQEQLNLIQEILMARMELPETKEENYLSQKRNAKTHSSIPAPEFEEKKERVTIHAKEFLPEEVPVTTDGLPNRVFEPLNAERMNERLYGFTPIDSAYVNVPIQREQGNYMYKPGFQRRGYHQNPDRPGTPMRRPSERQQYHTYYDSDGDDGEPYRPPPTQTYQSPNPLRGHMFQMRDGREGISPDTRNEHEERRMAIAGKYIQLHEALDLACLDHVQSNVRLKMATQKDFPHIALNELYLNSVISFFAVYDMERGRHNYNLRWRMAMFIHPTILVRLGVVASNKRWNMDFLPGGSAAHADDQDLRYLIQDEVRAKSYDDFMNKMHEVPFFEKPEDEGFRPEAYTFEQFMKFSMNYAERFCARAEIIAASAYGEHIPYVHKKNSVKGIFNSALGQFPNSTGTNLWDKCAFANPELRATKSLRELFQKFFAVLDPYKQGRLISDDFNTVIKRSDLVGKSLTTRLNDSRKDNKPEAFKAPEKGKRSDLNTTRIYGQAPGELGGARYSRDLSMSLGDDVTTPTAVEEDMRSYSDDEFDGLMAALAEEPKVKPCHAKFQFGTCPTPGCGFDHTEKSMQSLLKKRIWDLAKAAYRPETDKFLSYVDYAVKKVEEEKLTNPKKST